VLSILSEITTEVALVALTVNVAAAPAIIVPAFAAIATVGSVCEGGGGLDEVTLLQEVRIAKATPTKTIRVT
jgi:hypothetical protein